MKEVFPGVRMQGCYFHFTQCIWRKVQKHGLAAAYSRHEAVNTSIGYLLALPMLPYDQIPGGFQEVRRATCTPQLAQLFDYVDKQWITGTEFPPKTWSVYRLTVRTNNDVEGTK